MSTKAVSTAVIRQIVKNPTPSVWSANRAPLRGLTRQRRAEGRTGKRGRLRCLNELKPKRDSQTSRETQRADRSQLQRAEERPAVVVLLGERVLPQR